MNIQKNSFISKAAPVLCLFFLMAAIILSGCTAKKDSSASEKNGKTVTVYDGGSDVARKTAHRICVFVPGVVSGSPVYEMLTEGVSSAISEWNQPNDTLDIIEAGTNQAEWSGKLTALAASGKYDLIISSNPSLPELVEPLTAQFPDMKFILLDAWLEGNPSVATVQYNQREQAYMAGYAAGVATTAAGLLPYANAEKKIALIAAQEYPAMNGTILPAFTEGANDAAPGTTVEFRVVGNWYDASKGSEIAYSLYDEGVDVILPIAGGAGQGVIAAAQKLGFYITWFDDNGFQNAPGYVISSTVMEQKRMAYEVTKDYLEGKTAFGTARTVGIKEGYIRFVQDDPLYISTLPESCRKQIDARYAGLVNGSLVLSDSTSGN